MTFRIDGLQYKNGLTAEHVLGLFVDEKIPFHVRSGPTDASGYFRHTELLVPQTEVSHAEEVLGAEWKEERRLAVRAVYGFEQQIGEVVARLVGGDLVERTLILPTPMQIEPLSSYDIGAFTQRGRDKYRFR